MTLYIKPVNKTVKKMKYGKRLDVSVPQTITGSMVNAKTVWEIQFTSPALKVVGNHAQMGKFGWWINANASPAAILWMEAVKYVLNGRNTIHQLWSASQFVS